MKTTPVKGTNDYLPKEAVLRDYLQSVILETYRKHGFQRIMTPILEDIENLDKSEGGENLNLIFKVMKRGDKLQKAIAAGEEKGLSDLGLRYDLTLPLSRYYACHKNDLLLPMKCIQMDKVYRAERPQKGRLREFVQCDIDILGTTSYTAELELIETTTEALLAIGLKNFKVKVNDRRILRAILMGCGFAEEELDSVCISFDKLDKIGAEGVSEELKEKGVAEAAVVKLMGILQNKPQTMDDVRELCPGEEAVENLGKIMENASKRTQGRYEIVYDMSLVRGQGYYTGTVFEVESLDFKGAIAGGGRYDNLIGKFLNESVPAVGFSIGFERIFSILLESGFAIPDGRKRVAVLYQQEEYEAAAAKAEELRAEYDVCMYEKPKKVGKFIDKLEKDGVYGFWNVGQSEELNVMGR
jgi:histidyl-tRNA synthetase